MATTITLPDDHPSPDGVVAGVQFTKGRASVPGLGPHAAAFFRGIGARVRHAKPKQTDGEA